MANRFQIGGIIGVLISVLLALGLGATLYTTRSTSQTTSPNVTTTATTVTRSETSTTPTPCDDGPKINVTLRIENHLVDENFNHSVDVNQMKQGELILFLQKAADIRTEFRFSADYTMYGYYITKMNGLERNNDNQTWWKISDDNGTALNLGVSSYIPQDGETIVFSYVQGYGNH